MKRHLVAALFFVLASLAMTWPLARVMDRAVADPGDPFINIWILDWDHYATFHHPLSLFHANAFHPARYALAFSENLYGIALLLIPVRLVGVGPITAYNIAMLAGFALSGFGAYLLAHRLTGSYAGALAAGVFYAFVPFRFVHSSHLQHIWGGWLPLLLAALVAYADAPGWRRGAIFGAVYLMNALTNIHWFLFGSFATGVSAVLLFLTGKRRWKELLIGTAIALALFSPFLYAYSAASDLYGMTRAWDETKHFSATLSDWWQGSDSNVDPERRLYPGLLSIVLVLLAPLAVRQQKRPVILGALWIVIGVAGSLGLNFLFHQLLFNAVPGFKAIRVPARWAAIAYAGMAILIAVTCTLLEKRGRWVAFAIPLALLVALRVAPIRWYFMDPEPPAVYRWVAQEPVRAIVELPMDHAAIEYRYLLRATAHHKPVVNGVSGFIPPLTARLTEMSKRAPIPDAFGEELRRIGVELVIVHADQIGEFTAATTEWLRRELDRGHLRFVRRFDGGIRGDWVFAFARGRSSLPGPRPTHLDRFLAGQWTRNDVTFGLMQPPPQIVRGNQTFSGWALSPHGVRKVDLLFENGAVRIPTELTESKHLTDQMPWYSQTARPWFSATLPRRPRGVRQITDVQAEITDGRGEVHRLEHMWFEWR